MGLSARGSKPACAGLDGSKSPCLWHGPDSAGLYAAKPDRQGESFTSDTVTRPFLVEETRIDHAQPVLPTVHR